MADESVPFIEIDFTARGPDGAVFDTTELAVAQAEGLEGRGRFKPLVTPLAHGYLLEGLYDALKDKKKGSYTVEMPAEKAFGRKDPKRIKLISLSKFRANDMRPYPGMEVEVDGERGVVRSVNSGRVLVDYNHPMAGKRVTYELELKRFVTDPGECFTALLELVLGVPSSMVTSELDGKALKVTLSVHEKVPDAMFTEIAKIGAQLIEGVETIEIEQVEHDHSQHDHADDGAAPTETPAPVKSGAGDEGPGAAQGSSPARSSDA